MGTSITPKKYNENVLKTIKEIVYDQNFQFDEITQFLFGSYTYHDEIPLELVY